MSPRDNSSLMRKIALGLIICAVLGTEISYHFTIESRFDAIEEKLQQDGVAMQGMQQAFDSMTASKSETFSGLNKQLSTLQSSFEPLGKNSKEQADALDRLRQQLITLQQAQSSQEDAQKKLSDYIAHLEFTLKKTRAESEIKADAPKPVPIVSTPSPSVTMPVAVPIPPAAAPAPVALPSAPSSALHASAGDLIATPGAVARGTVEPAEPRAQPVNLVLEPTAPKAGAAIALRNDEPVSRESVRSPRALPLGASLSTKQ